MQSKSIKTQTLQTETISVFIEKYLFKLAPHKSQLPKNMVWEKTFLNFKQLILLLILNRIYLENYLEQNQYLKFIHLLAA